MLMFIAYFITSAEDMQDRAVLLPLLLIQITKKRQKNSKRCKPDSFPTWAP